MLQRLLITSAVGFALAATAVAQEQQGTPKMPPKDQAPAEAGAAQPRPPSAEQLPGGAGQGQPSGTPTPKAPTAPPTATAAEQPPAAPDQEPTLPSTAEGFIPTESADHFRAEGVIGASVVNGQDEQVGQITDLVFDADNRIVGVVISVGGFLGIGDKWVAVPMEDVQLNPDEQTAMADLSSDQLENAPAFVTRQEREEAAEQPQMGQQMPSTGGAPQ